MAHTPSICSRLVTLQTVGHSPNCLHFGQANNFACSAMKLRPSFGVLGFVAISFLAFTAKSAWAAQHFITWGFTTSNVNLRIARDDVVTWQWKQDAPHTLVSNGDTSFGVQTAQTAGDYSFTFASTGLMSFYCSIHAAMSGRIFITDGKFACVQPLHIFF